MKVEQPTIGLTSGTQSITGAKTFVTSISITPADGLTVGGIIVPTTFPIVTVLNALSVSTALFIADAAYQVVSVRASWGVVGGALAALNIEKLTGTTAPGSGTAVLTADLDLTGTVNTVNTGTLTGTVGNLQLAAGDRLGCKLSGVLTGLVGCVLTVTLKRI